MISFDEIRTHYTFFATQNNIDILYNLVGGCKRLTIKMLSMRRMETEQFKQATT